MRHAIHRVEHCEIVAPYTLALSFADGSTQRIDFRPMLEGEVFGPLQNLEMFNSVELDTTFGTVQWPNGGDFDPETLHDWPTWECQNYCVRDQCERLLSIFEGGATQPAGMPRPEVSP